MVLEESNMRRVKTEPTLSISPGEYMARKKREREEQVRQQQQQAAKRRSLDPSAGRQDGDRDRRSLDPSKLLHSSHDKQQPVRPPSTGSRHPSSVHHRSSEPRPPSVAGHSSNNPHPPPAGHMHGGSNSSTADKSRKSLPHAGAPTQSNSGANVKHSIPLQAHTAEQKVKTHQLETAKLVSFTMGGSDITGPASGGNTVNRTLPVSTATAHNTKHKVAPENRNNPSMPNLHHSHAKPNLPTLTIPLTNSSDMHKDMLTDITLSTPTTIATPNYEDSLAERNPFKPTSREPVKVTPRELTNVRDPIKTPREPPLEVKNLVKPVNIPVNSARDSKNSKYSSIFIVAYNYILLMIRYINYQCTGTPETAIHTDIVLILNLNSYHRTVLRHLCKIPDGCKLSSAKKIILNISITLDL